MLTRSSCNTVGTALLLGLAAAGLLACQARGGFELAVEPEDGSAPLETASVKVDEERNIWPAIWAITVIAMILLTLYLLFG